MKILLIGSHGYIGSKLYPLLSVNHSVQTLDALWYGSFYHSDGHHYFDFKELTKEDLSQHEAVVLLAGHSSVKMCDGSPQWSFKNNVENFIELALKIPSGCKLIYASSSSVYSGVSQSEVDESCNVHNPVNFYDLTKATIDKYAALIPNLHYYGLRFGTVNGASPNFRNEIMINGMITSQIVKKHIYLNNSWIKRPILDINDLSRGINRIVESGNYENRGIYNLASFNSTAGEIANEVKDAIGGDIILTEDSKTVYDFQMSCDKFRSAFNFEFRGTVKSISDDILKNWNSMNHSNRNLPKPYGN